METVIEVSQYEFDDLQDLPLPPRESNVLRAIFVLLIVSLVLALGSLIVQWQRHRIPWIVLSVAGVTLNAGGLYFLTVGVRGMRSLNEAEFRKFAALVPFTFSFEPSHLRIRTQSGTNRLPPTTVRSILQTTGQWYVATKLGTYLIPRRCMTPEQQASVRAWADEHRIRVIPVSNAY